MSATDPLLRLVRDERPMLPLSEPSLALVTREDAPLLLCWPLMVPERAWLAAVEALAALGSLWLGGSRLAVVGEGKAGMMSYRSISCRPLAWG